MNENAKASAFVCDREEVRDVYLVTGAALMVLSVRVADIVVLSASLNDLTQYGETKTSAILDTINEWRPVSCALRRPWRAKRRIEGNSRFGPYISSQVRAPTCGLITAPEDGSGDERNVPTTWIQPVGLLVNELVTNSAKHGAGRTDVSSTLRDGAHKLVVCDEGAGLAPAFDPNKDRTSLGMRIINAIVKQLGGTLSAGHRAKGQGTCVTVLF